MSEENNQAELINQISNLPFEAQIALIKKLTESTNTFRDKQIKETVDYITEYVKDNSQKYELPIESILKAFVNSFPNEFKNIFGNTVQEKTSSKNTTQKIKTSIKYHNPDNTSQTWTGKGPTPKWLKDLCVDGKTLNDFSTEKSTDTTNDTPERDNSVHE